MHDWFRSVIGKIQVIRTTTLNDVIVTTLDLLRDYHLWVALVYALVCRWEFFFLLFSTTAPVKTRAIHFAKILEEEDVDEGYAKDEWQDEGVCTWFDEGRMASICTWSKLEKQALEMYIGLLRF